MKQEKEQGKKGAKSTLAPITAILVGLVAIGPKSPMAIAGTHSENMKIVCLRVQEVNSKGFSGIGYLEWFFTKKNNIASAASIPGFLKELKTICPSVW